MEVSVDVFARSKTGEYRNRLPNCQVLPENIWLSSRIIEDSKIRWGVNYILRLIRKLLHFIGIDITPLYCRMAGKKMQTALYDAVVSYQEVLTGIVCYIPAKKKIAWIHCDYSRYRQIIGNKDETRYFKLVDKVVCVSEFTRKKFAECVPSAAEKSCAIHNIINENDIKLRAKDNVEQLDPRFDTSCFTIVSVGRLDPVKQFEKIPAIAAEVRMLSNKPFKWYIIGGSRGYERMEEQMMGEITKLGLTNHVIRLSEKSNVYPYIQKADLYVSTSLSEAFPLVVHEAKALCVPVLVNNFGVAEEIIQDGIDGFIVPLSQMGKQIAHLMEHAPELSAVKETLSQTKYDNNRIINSFIELIN